MIIDRSTYGCLQGKHTNTRRYKVAGHVFEVRMTGIVDWDKALEQYAPFASETDVDEPVFVLTATPQGEELAASVDGMQEVMRQSDEGSTIVVGQMDGHPCFEFWLGESLAARLTTSTDYRKGSVVLGNELSYGLNNTLMVMFALATACRQTALFHASVVGSEERGYLFLGKSGTGKSTHSSLWLKHIEGTELLNDDNPVVRIVDGTARVYGSPWSGKTPCYRNVEMPIGGFVELSQAPRNEIARLKGVRAYAALLPSISGMRWDSQIAEGLHETENLLAQHVPVWHLDCLPDRDAALLCYNTVRDLNDN